MSKLIGVIRPGPRHNQGYWDGAVIVATSSAGIELEADHDLKLTADEGANLAKLLCEAAVMVSQSSIGIEIQADGEIRAAKPDEACLGCDGRGWNWGVDILHHGEKIPCMVCAKTH